MFEPLLSAATIFLDWHNVLAMVTGLVFGILFGALPGLTASMAMALLIPFAFVLPPLVSLSVLAGIHNGATYGGAIPAVLLRIPGTPGAICTTFDGYPLAQQGRAGEALRLAAMSSAFGALISALALMSLAPPLSKVALAFGPPEIFWVNVFGLASISVLLGADPIKGLFAACFGLFVGFVGLDPVNGYERLMFEYVELSDGIPFLTVLVGMYALPPAWQMAERALQEGVSKENLEFKSNSELWLWPWRQIIPAWIRSSVIGVIVGILPGVGGVAASVIAYNEVKRVAKDPDSFGKGNPVGVAAAESSNSADNAASMIPALTLGVPGSGPAALMLGALLVIGVQPGPDLFTESPKLVFGYMWAMFATAILLIPIGGLIATKLFANVLRVPPVLLAPVIMSLTALGIYAFAGQMFFVWIMFAFGFIGYVFEKMKIPPAPVILGLLLGPKAEASLRISLNISLGDWSVLWTRPISQILIALVFLVIAYPMVRGLLKIRTASPES